MNIYIYINHFLGFIEAFKGKNMTFGATPFPIFYIVSKYLIYIAALLSKISAASLKSLALSTSALADITLDSPIFFCLATAAI